MSKGSKGISQRLNNILYFFGGILFVCLVAVIVIGVQTKAKAKESEAQETSEAASVTAAVDGDDGEYEEKWQEGVVKYNGKSYVYNNNLESYLLMGVDQEGVVTTAEDYVSGGQTDALFLLVADKENETLKVISINRNTMTKIQLYDAMGKSLGDYQGQICLQHGFGDGKMLSCTRTTDAVAYLFYNIPIKGYAAVTMGAIAPLNSAVGGVEVEVLQDLDYPNKGVSLKQGDTVTLSDSEAYCYLRGRDTSDFDSATDRLAREEQYVNNYILKLKSMAGGDSTKALDIYNSVSDYLVTNIDFESLIESLLGYEYTQDDMYTVPGKTQMGDDYEEYYVDEDEFYDLIIQIFYQEVEE